MIKIESPLVGGACAPQQSLICYNGLPSKLSYTMFTCFISFPSKRCYYVSMFTNTMSLCLICLPTKLVYYDVSLPSIRRLFLMSLFSCSSVQVEGGTPYLIRRWPMFICSEELPHSKWRRHPELPHSKWRPPLPHSKWRAPRSRETTNQTPKHPTRPEPPEPPEPPPTPPVPTLALEVRLEDGAIFRHPKKEGTVVCNQKRRFKIQKLRRRSSVLLLPLLQHFSALFPSSAARFAPPAPPARLLLLHLRFSPSPPAGVLPSATTR